MTRTRILIVIGGLALVLAGCGSSGKASFVAQANAICAKANQQAPPPPTGAQTNTPQGIIKYTAVVVRIGSAEGRRLAAVSVPAGQRAAYTQAVASFNGLITGMQRMSADLHANKAVAAQTVARSVISDGHSFASQARRLGLKQCANTNA